MDIKSLKELKFLLSLYEFKECTLAELNNGILSTPKLFKFKKRLLSEKILLPASFRVDKDGREHKLYKVDRDLLDTILLAEFDTKILWERVINHHAFKPKPRKL